MCSTCGLRGGSSMASEAVAYTRTYHTALYAASAGERCAASVPSYAQVRAMERDERRALASAKAAARKDVAVLALLIVLVVAGVLLAIELFDEGTSHRAVTNPADTVAVVVNEGDTLWSLSQRYPVEGLSTQEEVRWIMERNDLGSPVLSLGQVIEVPRTDL